MLPVSDNWLVTSHQPMRPPAFVKFQFDVDDPNAAEGALVDCTYDPHSTPTQILNKDNEVTRNYASLEPGRWKLDGNTYLTPTSIGSGIMVGYISEEVMTNVVTSVVLSLAEGVDIPGFSITWDPLGGGYADKFLITFYDMMAEPIYNEAIYDNTEVISVIRHDLVGVGYISIDVISWSIPNHRMRIQSVVFGVVETFEGADIMKVSYKSSVSTVSSRIPTYNTAITIDNRSQRFNTENPQGIDKYLQNRQRITLYWGFDLPTGVEWIKSGYSYLDKWEAPSNSIEATISGVSLIQLLTNEYRYGVYLPGGQTAYDIMLDLWDKADKPYGVLPPIATSALLSKIVMAPVPKIPINEALQLLASAYGITFQMTTGSVLGRVKMSYPGQTVSAYPITSDIELGHPEVALDPILKTVEVEVNNLSVATSTSELFKGSLAADETVVTTVWVDYQVADQSTVSATIVGGTIEGLRPYAYGCEIDVLGLSSVEVTIIGKVITSSISKIVTNTDSTIQEGATLTISNWFITDEAMARTLGDTIWEYARQRQIYTVDYIGDPAIQTDDTIPIDTPFGPTTMKLTDVTLDFNGGWSGTLIGRKVEPYV